VERAATRAVLSELQAWIEGTRPVAALLGPSGIGKTLLLHVLAERVREHWRIAFVPLPRPAAGLEQIVVSALEGLGGGRASGDPEAALLGPGGAGSTSGAEGADFRGLLLLIDDATSMPLATARGLASLLARSKGRVRLLVAADSDLIAPELLTALGADESRVELSTAMSRRETARYLTERLRCAGLLDEAALPLGRIAQARLVRRSGGIPALVNVHARSLLERYLRVTAASERPAAPLAPRPAGPRREPEPVTAARPLRDPECLPEVRTGQMILVAGGNVQGSNEARARDLYTSVLFRKRRFYAEQSGRPWYVLSAGRGLVDPDARIEPDPRPLSSLKPAERSAWSAQVARDLVEPIARSGARSVEVLAGATILEFGLVDTLEHLGVEVITPQRGLPVPDQLRWLDQHRAGLSTASTRRFPERVVPTADHAHLLAEDFASGRFGPGWERLPEVLAAVRLRGGGATPDGVRRFLTLLSVIEPTPGEEPDPLWSRGASLWRYERWVFRPEEVARRDFGSLARALERWGISSRPIPDAGAWRAVAEALAEVDCPGPIRAALRGEMVEGPELCDALQETWTGGSPRFPVLQRAAVAPRWLRRLAHPGRAPIKDLDAVPLPVDDDVQRATTLLGLVEPGPATDARRREVARVWAEVARLAGSFGAPPELDGTALGLEPAVTRLGRRGCCASAPPSPPGVSCRLCRFAGVARHSKH
jgi:type II secretory pathway predicted ATPase ExeA